MGVVSIKSLIKILLPVNLVGEFRDTQFPALWILLQVLKILKTLHNKKLKLKKLCI